MTTLLEMKDKMIRFCSGYELYIRMAFKFLVALVLLMMINAHIGYMERISSFPIAMLLALVCCLLPQNGTLCIAAAVILLDMYALSLEAALITFIVFAVVYLIYFRFAPSDGIAAALTPICFRLHIPFIMPIGSGLLRPAYSVVSVICGTVLYYFLDGIEQNASTLNSAAEEGGAATSKFSVSIGQLTSNKEMYLTAAVFLLTALVVYLIRRMAIENAWTIAIIAGILIQLFGLIAGYLVFSISGKTIELLLGSLVSLLIGFVIEFFAMNLDYARTERVQFEDDDYYYYVKAVPKKMVASSEKTVKHFGNTASMGKRIDRKSLAEEMDIDENLFQ